MTRSRRSPGRLLGALLLVAPFSACADGKTGPGNLMATNQLCESGTLDIDSRCRCCSNRTIPCSEGSSCAPEDASIECGDRCPAELTCFEQTCQRCATNGQVCGQDGLAACCTCWEELGARSCPAGDTCDCTTGGGGGPGGGGSGGTGAAPATGGEAGTAAEPSTCSAPCEPGAFPCPCRDGTCGPDELCMELGPGHDLCVLICTDPATGQDDPALCERGEASACGAVPGCALRLETTSYPEPITGCVLACEGPQDCPRGQTCRERDGTRTCMP